MNSTSRVVVICKDSGVGDTPRRLAVAENYGCQLKFPVENHKPGEYLHSRTLFCQLVKISFLQITATAIPFLV